MSVLDSRIARIGAPLTAINPKPDAAGIRGSLNNSQNPREPCSLRRGLRSEKIELLDGLSHKRNIDALVGHPS